MKVRYVGIETAVLTYGEEVEIRPEIEVGKIYRNRNGKWYLCKSIDKGKATMERTTDHWTLVAHGIRRYEDGTIEWNYSTGGHWKKEDLDNGTKN